MVEVSRDTTDEEMKLSRPLSEVLEGDGGLNVRCYTVQNGYWSPCSRSSAFLFLGRLKLSRVGGVIDRISRPRIDHHPELEKREILEQDR